MKRRPLMPAAIAFSILLLSGVSAFALEKVRLLIPVRSIDEAFAPFVVARELGYFEKEGYDVSLLAVGGSNESAIQISAGNGEIGAASPGESLVGIQSGKLDIRYFYSLYYANIWSVAVMPDSPIKAMVDLKDKKLGVQSMGSAGTTFGRAFVNQAGLDPQRDVAFLPIGMGAQAITSVKQKMVDGIVYWDAALAKFQTAGLDLRIVPAPENLRTLPDVGLLAKPETIAKKPEMLIGVARAVAKGYDFTVANPEAAVLITWRAYPEARVQDPDPAKALAAGVLVCMGRMAIWNTPKAGDKHGQLFPEDWQRLVQFMTDQKILPAPVSTDKVLTNELIDKINVYDRAAVVAQAKATSLDKLK
ncbi:MAG: putative exported protein [Hyphomicrobiales bacterium]|jgi:NitT/TauT family transport system substrate-binding protein|nr:putative exported protein [Hyphomicrobiales bacterium]